MKLIYVPSVIATEPQSPGKCLPGEGQGKDRRQSREMPELGLQCCLPVNSPTAALTTDTSRLLGVAGLLSFPGNDPLTPFPYLTLLKFSSSLQPSLASLCLGDTLRCLTWPRRLEGDCVLDASSPAPFLTHWSIPSHSF